MSTKTYDPTKLLRIKHGVLKRMTKDKNSYEKEAEIIMEKIKTMQKDGEDVYYIKKQDELLQETLNVISDCQRRWKDAFYELNAFLQNEEQQIKELEEFETAKSLIEVCKSQIPISQ